MKLLVCIVFLFCQQKEQTHLSTTNNVNLRNRCFAYLYYQTLYDTVSSHCKKYKCITYFSEYIYIGIEKYMCGLFAFMGIS